MHPCSTFEKETRNFSKYHNVESPPSPKSRICPSRWHIPQRAWIRSVQAALTVTPAGSWLIHCSATVASGVPIAGAIRSEGSTGDHQSGYTPAPARPESCCRTPGAKSPYIHGSRSYKTTSTTAATPTPVSRASRRMWGRHCRHRHIARAASLTACVRW